MTATKGESEKRKHRETTTETNVINQPKEMNEQADVRQIKEHKATH